MYFKTVVITTWTLAAWAIVLFNQHSLGIKILGCICLVLPGGNTPTIYQAFKAFPW